LEFEDEFEDEFEFEYEFEDFADPNLRASRLGLAAEAEMMAHFATLAANAETEAEAEAFLGAIIPAAARLLPKAAPLVRKFAPQLIRGVAKAGRRLWRNPATRNLVKAVPSAVVRTAGDLASQWSQGKPITPGVVAGSFSKSMADTVAGGMGGSAGSGGSRRGRSARGGRARGARRPGAKARRAIGATNRLNRRHQQRQRAQNKRAGTPKAKRGNRNKRRARR
jgi:hypothetical protein